MKPNSEVAGSAGNKPVFNNCGNQFNES